MRHAFLLLLLYGAALFVSCVMRPFIVQPPDNIPDARQSLPGLWTGSRGWGSFESKLEIEFRSSVAYTMREKPRNGEWLESNGYYEVESVRDRPTGSTRCAVLFQEASKSDYWFFRGGDVLFEPMGSASVSKNLSLTSWLIWFLAVPGALVPLPAVLLWRKVNKHFPEHITVPV